MTFSDFKAHSEPLFKELAILKVKDNIFLQNCLFVYDYFHGNLPKSFQNTFNKAEDLHSHFTRNARDGSFASKVYNSTKYGINSIYKLCNIDWNKITKEQKKIDDDKTKHNKDHIPTNLYNISRSKLKQLITDYFLCELYLSLFFVCLFLFCTSAF